MTPTDGIWSAAALLGVATVLWWSARRLAHAAWVRRSPSLGIAAWQCLTGGLTLSLLLSAMALLLPHFAVGRGLVELAELCALAIHNQFATPVGASVSVVGLLAVSALVGRLATVSFTHASTTRRARRQHQRALTLSGRLGDDGVTVVEHPDPAVYCLPGWGGRIVITSGAKALLTSRQMSGVIAHERAHLRHRHHLAVAGQRILATTFARVGPFQTAADEVSRLVEMQADDAAGRSGRADLARALVQLAGVPRAEVLNAGGSTYARVERLVRPAPPMGLLTRGLICAGATAALMSPVAVAVLPDLLVSEVHCCAASSVAAAASHARHDDY